MEETKNEQTKLTAAQRLMGLEDAVRMMDNAVGGLAQNYEVVKQLLELITQRMQAFETVLTKNGTLSASTVDTEVAAMNVEKLKQTVEKFKAADLIESAQEVTEASFVVGRELNKADGSVVNPRAQFWVEQLGEESRPKAIGLKVGSLLSLSDSDVSHLEIEEIYNYKSKTPPTETESPVQ